MYIWIMNDDDDDGRKDSVLLLIIRMEKFYKKNIYLWKLNKASRTQLQQKIHTQNERNGDKGEATVIFVCSFNTQTCYG